jgi:hypothetical protein
MGDLFMDGRDQLRENGEVSIQGRSFRLALLGPNAQARVDVESDATLEDVYGHRENARVGDVAVRVQVIPDPKQPFGIRDRLYQFFVVEGSRDAVRGAMGSGVLYEQVEGGDGEALIAFVNRDEVNMMISGEGFTITVPYQPGEPAAPAPVASKRAQELSIQSDADANAVPDSREYVDGDPDKGVRADAGLDRVALVGAEQTAKPGTTAEEGLARQEIGADPAESRQPAAGEGGVPADEPSDEELEQQADADGEATGLDAGSVDIATCTRPTILAQQFSRAELKAYAEEHEIDVYRRDGNAGQPLESDFARSIANYNRRNRK